MRRLADDLWRWTTPHPGWRPEMDGPGGWEREVGSVAARTPDGIVLIDPLVGDRWDSLDAVVAGRHVEVVLTAPWHERSAAAVTERYGATVVVHPSGRGRVALPDVRTVAEGEVMPGIELRPVDGADEGEVAVWIAVSRALVSAEVLTGSDAGLRIAVSPAAVSRDAVWAWVAGLLALPVERVLPAHGPPVLRGGQEAIAAALEAPSW